MDWTGSWMGEEDIPVSDPSCVSTVLDSGTWCEASSSEQVRVVGSDGSGDVWLVTDICFSEI